MPQNKRIVFSVPRQEVATYAHALSHPARLDILHWLQEHPFSVCDELAAQLPLARPTVSHHLRFLLKTGLIRRTTMSGMVGYELDRKQWEVAKRKLRAFLS